MNFILSPQIFPVRFMFMFGEFDKAVANNFIGEECSAPEAFDAACCFEEQESILIWMPREPETEKDIATLAHECLHAAIYATRYLGIQLSNESDEVYCYLLQWLVSSVLVKTRVFNKSK